MKKKQIENLKKETAKKDIDCTDFRKLKYSKLERLKSKCVFCNVELPDYDYKGMHFCRKCMKVIVDSCNKRSGDGLL